MDLSNVGLENGCWDGTISFVPGAQDNLETIVGI